MPPRNVAKKASPPPPPPSDDDDQSSDPFLDSDQEVHVVVPAAAVPAPKKSAKKQSAKKPTAAKKAASIAAVQEAFKGQIKGPTSQPQTETLSHEEIANMYPKYRVVRKEEFPGYMSMPRNMRKEDTVLLCTVCSEEGKVRPDKHFHATHSLPKLYDHLKRAHPEVFKTPRKGKMKAEDDDDGSEDDSTQDDTGLRNALARAILRSGVSIHACKRFLDELAPYMRTEADPSTCVPKLSADHLRSIIDDFVEKQDNDMVERFKSIDHWQ